MTSANIATPPEAEAASAGVDDQFLNELVAQAQAEGLQLTGEGSPLQQLTKRLLESALEGKMMDRRGYERRQLHERQTVQDRPHGRRPGGDRGARGTEKGAFEPQIVKERQRRLTIGTR
ncbi:hypothetical protein [Streptomyces sp. NPDC056549]|uniref:hypothetical protein n=1 Tax=Streptomyces sp. NPDC056549 TaxID=3345864 RepID=UPI0036A72A89